MDNIKNELTKAFMESDLSLSDENYGTTWRHIYQTGSEYQSVFRQKYGKKIWECAMHSDALISEQDQIRIIGFGAAITEHMVLPLNLSLSDRMLVIRIGALANFIVTFFDHYLDSYNGGQVYLPRPSNILGNKLTGMLFYIRGWREPKLRLLNLMIQDYMALLKKLKFTKQRPELLALLHRTIKTMYQAELKTETTQPDIIAIKTLRQKSALPFVVMALPGWLVANEIDKSLFKLHLMWSYRFGSFIGLLDDAVDLIDDKHNNQPNVFLNENLSTDSATFVANKIAQKGVRVKQIWIKMTTEFHQNDKVSEYLFPALIRSWIGEG